MITLFNNLLSRLLARDRNDSRVSTPLLWSQKLNIEKVFKISKKILGIFGTCKSEYGALLFQLSHLFFQLQLQSKISEELANYRVESASALCS
jgi:hypothetical protein